VITDATSLRGAYVFVQIPSCLIGSKAKHSTQAGSEHLNTLISKFLERVCPLYSYAFMSSPEYDTRLPEREEGRIVKV